MQRLMIILGLVSFTGCGDSEQDYTNAIRAAIAQDKQASAEVGQSVGFWESITGVEPSKLDKYVASMKTINMDRCPSDFRAAYQAHIAAWENYATAYRAGRLTPTLEKAIEDTWLVVNDRARHYGVQDALK